MSLKTRDSKEVLYSKSSYVRLFSATNQLNTLFLVSLWTMINTEERTLTTSPSVDVVELT